MLSTLALLGIVGGTIPSAATPTPPEPVVVRDSVVVTASLAEEEESALPVSVTVVGAEEIRDRQAAGVAELLATTAGLEVTRSGSPGKLTSLFTRGASSTHTLVLWNGIELNDPFFGGFDAAFLATEGVERLEVVRGPASVLYGSDALGGVVQVVSGHRDGAALRLEAGSDDYRRAGLAAGLGAGAFRFDLDGHLRRGDGAVANDFYDGEEVVARGEWTMGETATVGLVARGADATIGLPYDFSGQPSPRRTQERDSRQLAVPLRWRRDAWEVSAQLARHDLDLEIADPDDPFAASASEAEALTGRAVASRRFGAGGWLAAGGDWEREEATSASAFGPGLAADRQRTWAAFAEGHLARGPWVVDLGLRRDDNDAFGSEVTGRAGARRELPAGTHLAVAWAEGFRAPSLGDLFFPGFGNPELQPESSEGWELAGGVTRRGWRVEAAAFHTDLERLIVFDPLTSLPQNLGRARARGIETEGELARGDLWGRAALTWLDAEDRASGEPLPRRPEWSGSLVAGWRPGSWRLTASARWVGDRVDLGGVPLDAYAVTGLALERRLRRGLAPYGRVENLLDESYEEAVGFPAPGRTVIVGLAVDLETPWRRPAAP